MKEEEEEEGGGGHHKPGELFEAVQHGNDGFWWKLLTLGLRLVFAHTHQLGTATFQETHTGRDEGLLCNRNRKHHMKWILHFSVVVQVHRDWSPPLPSTIVNLCKMLPFLILYKSPPLPSNPVNLCKKLPFLILYKSPPLPNTTVKLCKMLPSLIL